MEKVCVLFTPGLDSFLCNYFLELDRPDLKFERYYFDVNSKYSRFEVGYLKSNLKAVHVDVYGNYLDLRSLEASDSNIPNRNILLATMAASIGCFDTIYINGMKDDRSTDNNERVFGDLSKAISLSMGRNITITSKFWDKEKSQVVREYIELGGKRFDLLTKVYSCFSPDRGHVVTNNVTHTDIRGFMEFRDDVYELRDGGYISIGTFDIPGCGMCEACFRRFSAIVSADLFVPFYNKTIVNKYRHGIDKDTHPNRYISTSRYIAFLNERRNG